MVYTTDTTNTTNTNFLELLVRHEAGVQGSFAADHMLDRFTNDLRKIAQSGGLTMSNSNLTTALTAFAMQAYYNNRLAAGEELFNTVNVSGGIHFNRSKVSTDLEGASGAKGYALYFTNYLATLSIADRKLILAQLPNLLDWYIQAGSGSMTATAGNLRTFMLGGSCDDTLTGGSLADVLVGNKEADDYDVRRVA